MSHPTFQNGWILPDEAVYDALQAGIADLQARIVADTIDDYLAQAFRNLPPARRAELKTWLTTPAASQKEPWPPKVIYGEPREQQELPCMAIRIDPEQEEEFVGQTGVQFIDPDDEVTVRTTNAQKWSTTIGVFVRAENGNLVRWLHHLAKFWLSAVRVQLPFIELHLGGRDLGFDPRYLQAGRFVYQRVLSAQCVYHQHSDLEIRLPVDDVAPTSPSEVGSHAEYEFPFLPA